MTLRSLALAAVALTVSACARDTPSQACSSGDAKQALVQMAAERVNRTIWMPPPLTAAEAKPLVDFGAIDVEASDPKAGVTSCRASFTLKGAPAGAGPGMVRYTVQKAGGANLYGAEDLEALVTALARAVGASRALAARPAAAAQAAEPPRIEELPPEPEPEPYRPPEMPPPIDWGDPQPPYAPRGLQPVTPTQPSTPAPAAEPPATKAP